MDLFYGEYKKIRYLGGGGFAHVHLVQHSSLEYIRALKESRDEIRDEQDKNWIKFLKECQMLLKIGNGGHPNIVKIYRPRLINNKAIVEMDYVEGETLQDYIDRIKFLKFNEIKKFIHDIVGAMAYCHVDVYEYMYDPSKHGRDGVTNDPVVGGKYIFTEEKRNELIELLGICHNDLHANNIMRKNLDGSFMLLDFGLAKQDKFNVNSSNNRGGAIEYSAPEKFDQEPTIRSDVYSLGVLLFKVLTGTVPFKLLEDTEKGKSDVWTAKREKKAPSIVELRKKAFEAIHQGQQYVRDYPESLDLIVQKCLEIKPENRYKNAKELLTALESAINSFDPIKKLEETNVKLSNQLDLAYQRIDDIEDSKIKLQTKFDKVNKILSDATTELNEYKDLQHDIDTHISSWKKRAIIFPIISGVVLFATAFMLGKNISPSSVSNNTPSEVILRTDTVFSKDGSTQIIRETVRDTVIVNHRDTIKIEVPKTITETQTKIEYRTPPEVQQELSSLRANNKRLENENRKLEGDVKKAQEDLRNERAKR